MIDLAEADAERRAFLAEAHIGILAVARGDGRPPIASPVATLTVPQEQVPYTFVTVSGPATVEPVDHEVRPAIVARYLPADAGESYLSSAGDPATMRTVRLSPRVWYSDDSRSSLPEPAVRCLDAGSGVRGGAGGAGVDGRLLGRRR